MDQPTQGNNRKTSRLTPAGTDQLENFRLDSLYKQHHEDTGWFADTLDYSLYGEPPAMLILAQRASLDLLDKIAVAANEHFQTGLNPGNITFRSYWFDNGSGAIRKKLPLPVDGHGAAIALAELSFDICPEGLYPAAQTLRNAGTHRLVHLTHGEPTGVTENTHSTVDFLELIHACYESLRVARAAYIYLIDLVNEKEAEGTKEDLLSLPLHEQM
ncbi:LA2681 family HEPN domain-containing protein [Arthrobacter sp. N199823]|uniref:LA2681 family HEPN domain-containing protein n=1 Tax=Arthrobacter sp. N199823 TaxID=2058895 RepID=UPI0011B0D7F4|nr:LA2681 family HEPN domain-containing protein [Arthrobacter sp. N199823]